MNSNHQELHVVFFPFMAHGHMIPTLDIARLFAARNGVNATIITTPVNATTFRKALESRRKVGDPIINIEVIRFPAQEVGLPEGYESLDRVMKPEFLHKFFKGAEMLSQQLEEYLEKVRPNCLVADMFFPWATKSAGKFNIPRLVFHGTSNFSLCAQEVVRLYEPFKNVSSDDEQFVIPRLPHQVKLTRLQISEDLRSEEENDFKTRTIQFKESELESYGVIVNSFYELEPDYAEFLRKELGRKTWNIGPVSLLSNRRSMDNAQINDEAGCLKWLDSKKANSVIYISFGSTSSFIAPQLQEIAMALEALGQDFIWVVRVRDEGKNEEWLPEGFKRRTEGKGLIIRGWAPQVLILEHEAIGGFVTHCGWNSTLEGISAGVPMVTWPIFAEQFYNEKLVTQILKIGVPVGAKRWSKTPSVEEMVNRQDIEAALREIMYGDEAEKRRGRAKTLKEKALKAVQGGSSYEDLSKLIDELRDISQDKLA